jgi:glycosyltransferase involved in cell wall biosynthesis
MQTAHPSPFDMKILLIHNRYKSSGGEDGVLQAESALLSSHKHHVEELIFDNNGITTFKDKLLAGLRLIYNPVSARALDERITAFNPDIIHVHNFVPLVSPSVFFVAHKHRVPVVVTLHNYRLICPGYTLFHRNKIYEKSIHSFFPVDAVMKGVYRNSRFQTAAVALMTAIHSLIGTWRNKVGVYIALTEFAKKKFTTSARAIPADKLLVKPNFIFDQGRGDVVRKDFFLFVGRLTEEKGIHTLLKATTRANFRLVIIGEGPLSSMVVEHAAKNPNIVYLGYQDKLSVMSHMKSCRALVFPSEWYEGFPLTILEALSTGTVIIASRLGGMAEIIKDGVNGLHFEAGNDSELAAKIMEVDQGPAYLKSISTKARSSYLEHYTPEDNYVSLMRIYDYARAVATSGELNPRADVVHAGDAAYCLQDSVGGEAARARAEATVTEHI